MSKVLLENDCVTVDKDAYCADQCAAQESYIDGCLEECALDADFEATAYVKALAQLNVTNTQFCATDCTVFSENGTALECAAPYGKVYYRDELKVRDVPSHSLSRRLRALGSLC